jgi:RimJ/RimL family protein N-acetyltransferase
MNKPERLALRKIREEDIGDLVEQGNDYDVHYNSFFLMKFPFGKKEALEVINEEKNSKNMERFGIELKEASALHSCQNQESFPAKGKIIGLIDLYNIRVNTPVLHSGHPRESSSAGGKLKLGYWIGRTYRQKGYATEAIKKIIKYAFEKYAVDEIIATTLFSNEASINLLKKLGFVKGKVLKNDRFLDGKYIDSVQWTMKRNDVSR